MLNHTAAILLIFGMAYLSGAAERPTIFGKTDNGKTLTLATGKTFRLELASNPTTGFDWHLEGLDTKSFMVVSSGFNPPNTKLVGAGGIDWWEIKALKPGQHKIRLLYYRIWEGKGKAVDQYTLQLKILPAKPIPPKKLRSPCVKTL